MSVDEPQSTDLVLVGGGHAHVQVLRRFMMRPLPGVRLSVVLDRPVAVYSGMVPGLAVEVFTMASNTLLPILVAGKVSRFESRITLYFRSGTSII